MSETITELRSELFATLKALRNKEDPLDIDRAKAITDVAQVIINSAKVEVEHLKIAGGNGSGFIPQALPAPKEGPAGQTVEKVNGARVITHRMQR